MSAGAKTLPAPAFTEDQLGVMQLFDTSVLAAAAGGELDLNKLASEYLAGRGRDLGGHWVGFPRATVLHNERFPAETGQPSWSSQAAQVKASRVATAKAERFAIGEKVFCTVTKLRGMQVRIVEVSARGDRIRIEGEKGWCPASNFQREQPK